MKGFEAMSDKKRHTIWIDERIWEDVLSHYKSDNCSTQNEFVENALRFYIGYLNTKSAGAFLPQAISSVRSVRWTTMRAVLVHSSTSWLWSRTYAITFWPRTPIWTHVTISFCVVGVSVRCRAPTDGSPSRKLSTSRRRSKSFKKPIAISAKVW